MSDQQETRAGDGAEEVASSRRALLGKTAAAAALATVAGLAINSKNVSAGSGNGGVFNIGAANTAAVLTTSLAGGSSLLVTNGVSNGVNGTGAGKKASVVGLQTGGDAIGVHGRTTGTLGGWGVYGLSFGTKGRGVSGAASGTDGVGVYGESSNASSGTGVIGIAKGGAGVYGAGATFDIQADGSGRVLLSKPGFNSPPSGGSTVGTIARDSAGNLWYSPASGQYRKLAGVATAGSFHAIAPTRVYDSRIPGVPSPGLLNNNENRVVSIKDARNPDTGDVTSADIVPAGATAIVFNLTVTGTTGGGFLSVVPGDAAAASGSSINWFGANQNLANGLTNKIAADRTVKVFAGGGSSTHFIIDVSGYYL